MERKGSARSFGTSAVAHCSWTNCLWRMAPDFGTQLPVLIYLRTNRHLDCVPIYAAGNRYRHFYSFVDRGLGNAERFRSVRLAHRKPIAPHAASVDGRVDDHSNGNLRGDRGTKPRPVRD